MQTIKTCALITAGLIGAAAPVQAITIYGLTATNQLISFDSASPTTVTTIGTISQPGIVDIDFFPVNNLLYAFTATGTAYSIDLATAAATLRVTPGTILSGIENVDFNPVADRIRLHGTGDTNYRMVPDATTAPSAAGTSGAVTVDATLTPATIQVVGNAYTNSVDGASATTLYSIDTTSDSLLIHSNSVTNSGAFDATAPVGAGLGVAVGTNVGFDISNTNGIAYMTNDNAFYTVNLATGAATAAGTVGGSGLVSIAATSVPEPSALVLGLTGMAFLLRRRRRA